jgi:hypothetical protein
VTPHFSRINISIYSIGIFFSYCLFIWLRVGVRMKWWPQTLRSLAPVAGAKLKECSCNWCGHWTDRTNSFQIDSNDVAVTIFLFLVHKWFGRVCVCMRGGHAVWLMCRIQRFVNEIQRRTASKIIATFRKFTSLTQSMDMRILETPPVAQPLRNFPKFYWTRKFITVFKRANYWSLSWGRWIQSITPQ